MGFNKSLYSGTLYYFIGMVYYAEMSVALIGVYLHGHKVLICWIYFNFRDQETIFYAFILVVLLDKMHFTTCIRKLRESYVFCCVCHLVHRQGIPLPMHHKTGHGSGPGSLLPKASWYKALPYPLPKAYGPLPPSLYAQDIIEWGFNPVPSISWNGGIGSGRTRSDQEGTY